jgi:hypothetical protein
VLPVRRNIFYGSLINQDYEALANLYANECMLVRPDGSVLHYGIRSTRSKAPRSHRASDRIGLLRPDFRPLEQ